MIWPGDPVGDYLGQWLIDDLQALYYFDACLNVWKRLYPEQEMVPCKGYWLSTLEAGVIRF
jgi:hypothetical protein